MAKRQKKFPKRYPSDLTPAEWEILAPLIPDPDPGGRPYKHPKLELLNAMLYVIRSGCNWDMLPKDFPPYKTVYHHYRKWSLNGTFEEIHNTLASRLRERQGRKSLPSALIVDSQSVKTWVKKGLVAMTQGNG